MTKTTKLVNLTPHAITFCGKDGDVLLTIEPSGSVARVSSKTEVVGILSIDVLHADIPVTKTVFGVVEGLPEPKDGVAYVVSSLVAQRVPERTDVFVPAQSVRDDKGRIVGCMSLGRI